MTSTNDGKDVKSNQTSGPKGKTYYIELYKSLEAGLSKDCDLSERTSKLCDAWRRVHSLCAHSASSTHPHLLSWLQRHTARTVLQTEWQDPTRKDEHKRLEEAIDTFIRESQSNDGDPPWQTQLVARGEWFKRILDNPWGHPVLRVLLDPERGETPKEEEVLEWLKEERGVMFVTRLRQLASSKNCHDLALRLASAVLDRVRACMDSPKDDQAEELKEKPKTDNEPTFLDILKAEAGFTVDVMEFLTDIEFVLLHKRDKLARCIELAKQTPLRNGYQLVERLQSRLETSPREKKLWKNAKEVATLIAQVVIARCMVVPVCGGVPRTALYCCSRSLARLVAPPRLPAAAAALAAPAATARHLHTLAAAVDAQCKEDMKPFVCELYVRAITAGMNELERFKLNADKESEARASEQTLSQWFVQLGGVLAASERMRCECTLTAFSVHPAPAMFDKIHAAPALPPVALDIEPKNEATTSEFGSWASDSRSQTNFVKTSETLKLKHTQNQANVLSTAILTEGEAIGLSPELCQDIAVLLSGPRLKTLSWDMDRQVLLDNCRAYMERTACGTRALTTELKFLNLDLRHYQHLPEEDDDDTDIYYGIEKGYEHLVEFQEPEDIWEDADDPERTTSAHTTDVETEFVKAKTKKKTKKIYISSADEDPLSFVAETKRIEKKKERPHSKERSKERKPKTKRKPRDPLEITEPTELIIEEKTDHSTERKTDLSTERKADHSIDRKEDHSMNRKEDHSMDRKKDQSVERKKDQNVERNKDLSVERNKDLSAAKNKNQSTEKKQRKDKDKKKEKKERKRKEKIVLVESKPSSLSSLIGMKVTKVGEQRKPIAAASSTGVTTDSNYDSQGKSSINSLISDGNDTDVVFDGLFSMDELKSPDKAYDKSDKMGIMKNNEVQTANGKVRVNTSDTKKIVTNRVPTPTLLWTNNKLIPQQHLTTVAEDVKKSISKLIHFRRQKALSESPEQRNLLASPGYQTYSNKNMRAQTSQASTSDSPKVCMSKSQSEQLTELRNEVNNFLNNKEYMSQPVIQYSQNQKPNFIFNNAAPSGVKILNSSVDRLLQQKPSTSNDLKVIPKTIEQPQKSIPYIDPRTQKPMVSHQKNYTDFVKELQKSINAGAGDDHTVQVKKEIKPISRVIPVLPKSEPKVTQSAKQSVKKSELAPNTFSRLSYYKSNKNDIKTKQFVESVIEHQNLKLQNTPKLSNLDRMMMEHAKAKSKHLHITSQTVAKPSRPSNNTQNITKSSTNTTSDHPTIASLLQSSSSTNTNKTPVNQYKTVERPRDRSTPLVNKVSMLSEKDQQDLVLLLRQQSKQNLLRPKQETPTERIPPSQSNTRTILPTYSAPSLLNKKVLDATTSVIKNNPTLLKPNQTLKASHEVRSVAKPIIVKTELSQTKNLDQVHNKIQKVEIIDNEGRSIKSKVITKHQDSSKPTDWESVMDAILKHKTPSRGPNALDMALNKDTYVSTFENNLRNQRIIRTPSCPSTELTKPNNTAESPAVQAKQAAAKTAMELAGHSPNILRRPITAKEIKRKSPKRSTKTQKVASNPATEVIINSCSLVRSQIPEDLTVLKPHTPKKIVTEKRQRDTTAVPKKVHTDSKKHQFTCTLSKQDDPFISGIPNSDYDLLEELMDDDLRQEIGELLSDEESYSASLQSVKDSKTFVGINKTITPVIQEDKRVIAPPVIAALTKPEFKKHVQKTVCQNTPKPVYETATPVQQSIGYVNVNTVMNLTEYTKLNINNANTPVHQIPKSVIVPPKKEQTYIATVPAVDHTIVAVPQQTALQNVVLIGSELVYQPCVQTPVHTGIAQNTFVTFGQPNIAVYQTTQFAAPVVNPLFIGRAITTPTVSVSVPIVKSAPSAETIPYEVPTLVPSSQEPQKCEMPKTSTDPKTETKSPVDYSPHDDISIKDKCDINSNKTCERKVLSEVQEKQKLSFTEKIESRNTKSRGVSFEHDVKKAADQERLKKKRMAILNRKIYHRSDDKPIPLTYMPLNKKKPELVTAQENNRASRNSPKMTDNNCIIVNLQALLNAKIRTLTELEKRPAKITEKDSSENCKENKSEIEQCRRILLRSSNKLSSEMAVKPSSVNIVPTKTNAKLKDDNSTTKSEDTNEIKSVKEIKKQGLNKTLNKAIKKMEIKKRITRQTIKNATNADHDTAEETKEDEKITTASDVETKPASHSGQTAVFEKTTSPDVDHEETAIIDDEKTAAIDLEKSESTDLEKTAAVDLEKTVAIDLKNTATIDFEKTAANDLDKKPAIDLKNTAAIDFEKTSAVDIENTAAIDVQKTFDVDFEKTVAVDVENTAAIDYEKTAANDLEKTRTIDFDKTVAIDTDKTTAIGLVKTADINLEKTTALNVEKSVAIDREITAALDYVKPTAVDHEKIDNVDDDKTETAVAEKNVEYDQASANGHNQTQTAVIDEISGLMDIEDQIVGSMILKTASSETSLSDFRYLYLNDNDNTIDSTVETPNDNTIDSTMEAPIYNSECSNTNTNSIPKLIQSEDNVATPDPNVNRSEHYIVKGVTNTSKISNKDANTSDNKVDSQSNESYDTEINNYNQIGATVKNQLAIEKIKESSELIPATTMTLANDASAAPIISPGDQTEIANSAGPEKESKIQDNEPDIICLDDPNTDKAKTCAENLTTKEKNDKLPQSFIDGIKIEDLPNGSDDPLKKCVRIRLPNGRAFKATVRGQAHVNIDTLFADPGLKSVLLSNISNRNRYTLNIKQISTTIKSQPDKILETRIHEISLQPSSNPILDKCLLDPNKVETINLLSDDDEDDDNCQYFNTEFGKYKVPAMKRKLHENHQKVFDKKCVVKLKREFLQQSFEIPSELTTMESDLTTMETDLTTIESDVKHQGSDMSQSKHEIKSLEPNVKPQDTEVIVPDDITSIVTTALPIATETYKFQDYLAKNISENRIKGPEVIEIDDSSNDDPRLNTKNISKTCEEKIRELKDLLFKDLAMELIDHNTPVIHVAPTQSIPGLQISDETDFQSSPPLPLPLVNANCYIKLTKCDKLVKKYNDLKSIKQCSVKLVRCDGNIQNDTSTNSEESSSEMDVDDDIIFSPISLIAENVIEKNIDMSGESISRCASLSILNDYSLFDQPLAIATHRSTSPVMEVYESIAALYNRETTEVKYEQWTCETEWFMSKLEFHLLNKRNNTIISESVRKLSVPSLVTILTKFFQDNHIETQYKPVNTCHGTLRYAKNRKVALSPSHHLKRKSLDNVQVDVKISKKSKGTNIVASCHEINVEIMTPKKTEKQKKEEIEGNTHDAFLLSADANIYYVHENPFHELHTTDSTMNGALAAYKHLSSFGNQLHDVFTEITDDEKSSNQASATLDFEHHVNSPSNTAGTKDSEQSRHNEEIVLQKTKESIDHDASAVPASSIVETHHTNIEDKRLSHCEIILTKINAEEDTISQMQLNENVINDLMAIEENTAINCEIDVNPSGNKYEATVISENSESLTSVSDPEKDTVTSTDLVVSEVLKQSNQCKEFISNKSYDTLVNCETFSPISQPDFSEVMVQESKGHIENDCEIIVPCESTDSMNDNISISDEITIDESPTKSGEVINIDVTITKNCPSFNNEITNSEVLNEVMKNDLIQQIHEALQRPDEEIDFIDSSIETTLKLKETQEIGIVSSTNDIQMIPDTSNDEQVKLQQEDRELDIVSTQKGYPSHEVCDLEEQTVDGNSSIEADSTSIEYSIYSNNDHVPIDVNSTNITVASEGADKVVLVDRPLIETDQMDYDNMDVKTAENMISSSTENITQNIVFKNDNYEETALTKENLIRNDDVLCNISSQLEDELYKNRTSANDNIIDNECIPNGHDIEVSKQCEVIKRMPEKSHDEIQKDPNTIETSNKDIEYNLIEDVNMCKKLLLEEELSQIVLGHGLSENQEDIYIDPQNQSNALSNNSNDVIKATTAFLEDMRQHLIDVLGSPIKNLSNPQIGDIIERQHLIDVLGSPIKNLSNPQIGDKIDLEKTPTIHNNNYEIKLDSNNVTEDIVNNHDGKIKKELTQKVTDDKNQQLNKEQEQTESVSEIKPECKEHDDEIKMNSPREVESVAFLDGAHNDLVDDVVDVRSNDELEQELARIVLGAADNANKQILNINADNLDIDEVKVCCVQPSELQKLMQMNIQDSKSNLNLDECEEPALYACSSIQEEEDIIQITQEMDEYGNVKEIDIRLNVPKITYSRKLSGRSYAYGALFGDRKKRGLKRKTDMADVKTPEKKYRKGKNIDTPKLTNAAMADTTYFKEFKRLFDYCSSVKFSYSRPFHKEYINVAKLLTEWPLNDISNIVIDSQIDDTLFTDTEIGIASYNDPLKQTLAEEIMKEYSESYNSSSEVNETNFQMGFGERSGRVIQNSGDVGGLKFSAATLSDVKQTQPLLLSEIYDNCNSEQDRNINTTKSEIEKLQRNYKCIQLKNKVRSFFKQTMVELNNDWNKQNDKHDDIYSNSNSEVDSSSFPFGLNLPDFIIPSPVEVVVQVVQVGQLPVSAAAQNPVTCDPRVTQVSDASPSQCSAENSPNDDPQSAVKTEYTELTTADISLPLQEYTQHHSRLPVDSDIHVHMSHDIVIDDIKEEIKAEIKEEPDLSDDFSDHFDNNDMINNGSSPMGNSSIVNSVEYLYNANAPHQEPTSETLSECTMEILFNSNDKPQGFENYLQQHQAAQLPQQNQAQLSQQTQQSQLSQQNHQAQLPQQNHHAQQPQQNHQAQFSHQNHQQQQPHQNQQAQLPQQNHQAQLPQQNKQVQLPQQNQQAQLPQQNQQAQLPQQSQQAQLPQQNQQAQHPHQNQQAQQQHQVQIVQQNQQAQLPQQHQQAQIQQQTQQGQQQQQNHQEQQNGSPEKTDQIAHAMNAAGITTNADNLANSRAHALVNILSQKLRQGSVQGTNSSTNSYQKTTQINAMALQQALAQILPPPLNQTGSSESNQQNTTNSPQVTSQVLHIVQGKNATGNQITLVDNSQPSVISTPNNTPVLHIVQNKSNSTTPTSNGTPAPQTNSFSGLSLVDAGLQQGNQLLHIVNAGNQKNNNAAQLLRKVNLLTNLANVQGSNEQKMVQFVCKSADGKSIQLNASHQRSMVLRLQPVDTPSLQLTQTKPADSQDMSPTPSTPNNGASKESAASQQEIKSRSVYEENYAKFIQSSNKPTVPEKATSLPKFGQAFGKQVFQDGNQKNDINNGNSHLPSSSENPDCQANDNAINLDHLSQMSSPPLLLRKSPQTSQAPPNLVQQLKQTISPMNMSMHGGVIYTRQIPVNIGGGQTINLITVPSTDLIDDSAPKHQGVNQEGMEPSIIKIVPQTPASTTEPTEESNSHTNVSNESGHTSQPQPVLTQMRIKLPMLSKTPQMVGGARLVRPSFFQIQRNVIGGANQPVYQQLVLTAAPPLGQQTIRLPQAQTNRPAAKVASDSQSSSSESQMSSSTLEQLREFDLVLEQVKERSTGTGNGTSTSTVQSTATSSTSFSKLHTPSTDTTDSSPSVSSSPAETTQQVLYSIGNTQPLNVAYVNRKAPSTSSTSSSFVRSPDSSGIVESPTSSTHQIPRTVTSESSGSDPPSNHTSHNSAHTTQGAHSTQSTQQPKPTKPKPKPRPKAASNPPNTLKLPPAPPKPSTQKPAEDEQTTQRILYILAEYKEQVENSPDKDKPAPRRRTNPPSNPGGSSKRKKSSSGSRRSGRDISPCHGEDTCRTMGSEDSSCGTSQGDCNESCLDSHSPQDSPRKVARKLTFEHEASTPISQPRPQPQRNVIVADGQTITVARGTAGKPTTAVLMPANYILPVSMVKGGQQIAIVTNRGPKLLTVGGGEGGATNALLLQRLIGPAGLKPVLARPGVRHVRLPTAALHNLQTFNLATTTTVQPPDSTASPAPAPTPPDLVDTRAASSPWRTERDSHDVKPERGSSPEGSEPWNLPPSEYSYEETVRGDNMDRTVLDPIPDRYSPDMEAQRIFDKMFDVDSKKSYMVGSHDDSPRCGYDIDASDCDDKAYHQVVHKKDGSSHRPHRFTHVSAAALRHKYAILEHELRLQKSLSEECEDLGVDSPSASELFPEAELLFAASPAHDHTQDQGHHSHTPQPLLSQSGIPQPDLDDQIATDQLLPRAEHLHDERELGLGLEDVGIVTVSEDGLQATIELDQEEFARSHPNTTFHSEPTDEGEVQQPFTISGLKGRHITSTIFHANRPAGTVLMTAPQTTVISQATAESSGVHHNAIKYSDIDNMINSLPGAHTNNINLSSVLVKDDGLSRFDNILNDTRELRLSNTASAIVHSAGHATQVIRRVRYGDDKRERDGRFLADEPDGPIAGDDAKMAGEDSSRDATLESTGGDTAGSSPERHADLFWESNSASGRADFSSDSDKCCKSPSDDASTDSSAGAGARAHLRLDSVIKEARGLASDDDAPPLRTYPAPRSLGGKTAPGARRRASARALAKRGSCLCCAGDAPRAKRPRARRPALDLAAADCR